MVNLIRKKIIKRKLSKSTTDFKPELKFYRNNLSVYYSHVIFFFFFEFTTRQDSRLKEEMSMYGIEKGGGVWAQGKLP